MSYIAFLDKLEPSEVNVAGARVRLFFSFHAAARMEQLLERNYESIVMAMVQAPDENGVIPPPLPLRDQCIVIRCLMEAAGNPAEDGALEELHMLDFSRLARAALREILSKMPRQKKTDSAHPAPDPNGHS